MQALSSPTLPAREKILGAVDFFPFLSDKLSCDDGPGPAPGERRNLIVSAARFGPWNCTYSIYIR